MEDIKFDFNNMLEFCIGKEHGVQETDLEEISVTIEESHKHLSSVIANSACRIKLGLEWMKLPYQDKRTVEEIRRLGEEISAKYENVIFLGIGGSYLGLKAAQDALCAPYYNEFPSLRHKRPRVYFEGNNLDPQTLRSLLGNLIPKKTFVVVISKSGETTETKAAFMAVEQWLKAGSGKKYARQILAITDPESGSLRKRIIEEQKKDRVSFRNLPLLKGVGGRFSEFNMGLLHLAVCGIDIRDVLDGAKGMEKRCACAQLFNNPAYMYAALHYVLYKKKNKSISILMPFCETLKSSADWYIQLLAESLGKKYARKIAADNDGAENWIADKERIVNVGRTPASFRGTGDLHSIQQNNIEGENNKAVTFIRVEKFKNDLKVPADKDILSGKKFSQLLKLAQEATEWALVQEHRPNCTIIVPQVSAYHWGALLFFFEVATAFEGELLGINAFDQPGVEGYKNYMYCKLGKPGIPESISQLINNTPLTKNQRFVI